MKDQREEPSDPTVERDARAFFGGLDRLAMTCHCVRRVGATRSSLPTDHES